MANISVVARNRVDAKLKRNSYPHSPDIFILEIDADRDSIDIHFPDEQAALAFAEKHNFQIQPIA